MRLFLGGRATHSSFTVPPNYGSFEHVPPVGLRACRTPEGV
jgi:hypothetical protein